MARKKRNPSSLAKIVGVAVVAGLVGYGAYQAFKKPEPKKKKSTPEDLCAAAFAEGSPEYEACVAQARGEQASDSQAKKQGKYVGTGWTGWPHKDLFGDERAFGDAIVALGYAVGTKFPDEPGWSARDSGFIAAVKDFQNNWNLVIQYYPEALKETYTPLQVDGKLGKLTIEALYEAVQADEVSSWQDIVSQAEANKKAVQS